MKHKFFLGALMLVLAAALGRAQIPQTLSYQGVLKNTDGTPVVDGNYTLVFKLDDTISGKTLWSETQTRFVSQGLFDVILGSVTPINLPFDRQYSLGITVGAGTELTPRTLLTASAYSFNARSISDGAVTNSKIVDRAIDITKLNFTPLTSENDPQVGNNATYFVPRWDGAALSSGTIYDNGNIGIGKTNPTQKLDIAGGIAVNGSAVIDGSGRWVGASTGLQGPRDLQDHQPNQLLSAPTIVRHAIFAKQVGLGLAAQLQSVVLLFPQVGRVTQRGRSLAHAGFVHGPNPEILHFCCHNFSKLYYSNEILRNATMKRYYHPITLVLLAAMILNSATASSQEHEVRSNAMTPQEPRFELKLNLNEFSILSNAVVAGLNNMAATPNSS